MYFIVIMAFAFVLSDNLPPERLNVLPLGSAGAVASRSLSATLAVVLGHVALIVIASLAARAFTVPRDPRHDPHERAANRYSRWQAALLGMLAAGLVFTMVMTPWARIVRNVWGLGGVPLAAEIVILTPFFTAVIASWVILYPVEARIRREALRADEAAAVGAGDAGVRGRLDDAPIESASDLARTAAETNRPAAPETPGANRNHAAAALAASRRTPADAIGSVGTFVLDKLRHQVLIIAAPMLVVVFVKHFTDEYRDELYAATGLSWLADLLLGCTSAVVLALAPCMLRYIWSTEPLPPGPLRDRFVRICDRIGLRYREILLWHTHGLAVNAAVMGFVAPIRYILVSDALLDTMEDEEIEAVFGHEAGHVRHFHLQFFMLFVLVSMYVTGGVIEFLYRHELVRDGGLLQIVALTVLFATWLFGFGWLSRRFERQADLYGVRCVTPDIRSCVARCPVHGVERSSGICTSAAQLFGRTLNKIGDLNGIPREASSWRHGSIQSRCRLIEDFTSNQAVLRRFDRSLVAIKAGLILASLLGTAVAAKLYYPQIAALFNRV